MSDRIESALEACQDAALGVAEWPLALQSLCEALGAVSGCLRTRTRPNPFSRRHDDVCGVDSTEHAGFSQLWLERVPGIGDPRFNAGERSAGARVVIFEDQVISSEVRARHPFYTQVAGPGGRDWWASVLFEVDGNRWRFPLFRDARRGRFEQVEEEVLRSVAPGLARAVRVAGWVLDLAAGSILDAFDLIGEAALVLDDAGAVLAMNASAAALMGDALRVKNRRLCAAERPNGETLRALVARAAMGVAEVTPTVLLTRKGRPWLKVDAMPFTGRSHDLFGAGRVLLRLSELAPSAPGEPEQLRRLFGLTVAEARLAVPLARGEGLVAAAERLGIGRETACTQLRAILAKTGTSRQAELAALLARLPRVGPAFTRSEDDRPAH